MSHLCKRSRSLTTTEPRTSVHGPCSEKEKKRVDHVTRPCFGGAQDACNHLIYMGRCVLAQNCCGCHPPPAGARGCLVRRIHDKMVVAPAPPPAPSAHVLVLFRARIRPCRVTPTEDGSYPPYDPPPRNRRPAGRRLAACVGMLANKSSQRSHGS